MLDKFKGKLIIISAPSGGGKTTVVDKLAKLVRNSARLVTTTTRVPRPDEVGGVDYNFLSKAEFEDKVEKGDFIEHVEYADEYYGVDSVELGRMMSKYEFIFAPIDVRGKECVEHAGIPLFSIFLLPENLDVLRERLSERKFITKEDIEERMVTALKEIEKAKTYDAQVVNRQGHLDDTVSEILKILPE